MTERESESVIAGILRHRRQRLTDAVLFIAFIFWTGRQLYALWEAKSLDFVEISFVAQNLVMAVLFLVRAPHSQFNTHFFHQTVAAMAFLSGAALIGQPQTAFGSALAVSQAIVFAANVLGLITMFNLGRSFGVFIACREVRSTGLYGMVRHPMYASDILLRAGYLISHATVFAAAVVVLSSVCYVYRAILEERFLVQQPEYAEYVRNVKFRFIPFVY